MTHELLEEARARIEDREYYASVAPHLHAIASELLAEVKRLRARLEIIADPIAHFISEAKARGERLDGGMAIHVSQDAGWHQQQARDALAGEEPT